MAENNEMTLKKVQRNKRKTKKIALLFFLTGITAILLIVETYAWFVGTTTIKTSNFEISVSSGDSFLMSLNGSDWSDTLTITKDSVVPGVESTASHKAYSGHTNVWPDDAVGLIPLSTAGETDAEKNSGRLKLFGKSSLTATGGGFRLISTRIDNYKEGKTEAEGYVAFDLFIKNGTGVDYIKTYNRADDEAVYLQPTSKVEVVKAGDSDDDYGLANSVRVAFVQIGRVAATTTEAGTITSITCQSAGEGASTENTPLCSENDNVTIWEPNENKHHKDLVTYFNRVCKKKTVTAGEGEGAPSTISYEGQCTPVPAVGEGGTASALGTEDAFVPTYVVKEDILSSNAVDIYDGINGTTSEKLSNVATFTDTMKNKKGDERPAFFYLAPNSITKVRVYIYLEGQDIDNYDLASLGKKISVEFAFTKDKWDLANGVPAEETES